VRILKSDRSGYAWTRIPLISALLVLGAERTGWAQADTAVTPPAIAREFRGLWVATVDNMDWPSRRDLTTEQQQAELLAILDRASALHMNAIVLQVRPEADALYESRLEPWSRYLTGTQGRAPNPRWDPLAFAVREAHKRGLELHAWFNPYRAQYVRGEQVAPSHVSVRHPGWVVPYGPYRWMNPGITAVRQRMVDVLVDVVDRYDIDGVHIDDYFYPYPETRGGRTIPFPDAATYRAYLRNGGDLSRGDWRRRNVDLLVRQFHAAVRAEKPWVKVGISPFGVWRPDNPPGIRAGIDTYSELFADSRKWLREGWLDYLAPQLYWPVSPPEQSYPVILKWWVEENVKGRHVWPGLPLYKLPIPGPKAMRAQDIIQEILLTRQQPGATGHIHFDASILMQNVNGIADRLAPVYSEPALVPASPWLDSIAPAAPRVSLAIGSGSVSLRIVPGDDQRVRWWVVQRHSSAGWRSAIVSGQETSYTLSADDAGADVMSVTAVDRSGNAGKPTLLRLTH
jgi:uncharacterized lipoprotein YddW (UPF0748 family)